MRGFKWADDRAFFITEAYRSFMKPSNYFIRWSVAVAVFTVLSGCAGMSTRDRHTIAGAGIGALAGSVLTGGSSIGTVGGAAVGGVIGSGISHSK